MFRTLARLYADPLLNNPALPPDPAAVFTTHPAQLARWLEEVWQLGGSAAWPGGLPQAVFLGDPQIVAELQLPVGLTGASLRSGITAAPAPVGGPNAFDPNLANPTLGTNVGFPLPWENLIYAYLVECTGIVEIFTEVLRRYLTGESLEVAQVATHGWLRATEELFYRDPPLFSISGAVSELRPTSRINRRNAYWRMFGMDLPHPLPGSSGGTPPWKREAGQFVNTRFRQVWTDLLRQIWLGIENDNNSMGANPTDASYVAYLCETLAEMSGMRRRTGSLAREEFIYVSTLSWYHLAVESETVIVQDLQAGAGAAGDPGDRLARVATRVGMAPPQAARELFELADLVSVVLRFIEAGFFNSVTNATLLYTSTGVPNPVIAQTMNRIVDLWQSATGEPIKGREVRMAGGGASTPPQPTRLPSGTFTAPRPGAAATNGSAAAAAPARS